MISTFICAVDIIFIAKGIVALSIFNFNGDIRDLEQITITF